MVITGKYWSVVLTLCGASVAAVAAQQALTEAPAGFDTPTPSSAQQPIPKGILSGIEAPQASPSSRSVDCQFWATMS